MSIKLSDMLKKAQEKGITSHTSLPSSSELLRPWQHESVLFQTDNKETISPIETQLEHNKDTIRTQTSSLSGTFLLEKDALIGTHKEHVKDTSKTQLEHKTTTTRTQLEHKKTNRSTIGTQQEHAKEHIKEHNKNTIGTHKEHNKNTTYGLSYLTGIQKQLVILFYSSCKKTRSHVTEEFSLINIADALNIKVGSVKTSLRRLEEKKFIVSVEFKKGRGGWTKFELPDYVYRDLLENEKKHDWNTIGAQLEHNRDTYGNTEKDTSVSSSSGNNINIKNTTNLEIAPEWDFDIGPYEKFGFTRVHIKQLAPLGQISAADVEQSLIEFNYDLENNALPTIRSSKIHLLMGLFRKGQVYISEGYRKEEEAAIKLMAERSAAKKRAQLDEKFAAWEASLTEEQQNQIVEKMPNHLVVLFNTYGTLNEQVRNWFFKIFMTKSST